MVDVNKLKGLIVERGLTQTEVYNRMGLSKRQWQCRIEKKKFDSFFSKSKSIDFHKQSLIKK